MPEQVERKDLVEMKEGNANQILMICDSMAWRFQMENCTTIVLDPNVGFEQLISKVHPELDVDLGQDILQFKLLILMMGRADYNIPTMSFTIRWYGFMEVIKQFYPDVTVLVTPSLWAPGDSVGWNVDAWERSEFLAYYAHDHIKVEFIRPAEEFWYEETPVELYYDNLGNLTELGIAAIRSQLNQKIQLFGLLDI